MRIRVLRNILITLMIAQASFASTWSNSTRHEYIEFGQSLVVSQAVFTSVNAALFRDQMRKGQIGMLAVAGISAIEVAENLANFVQIETMASYVLPLVELATLVHLRAQMPALQPGSSYAVFILESVVAKFIKNKINFMVTENWYPKRWLLK